MSNTHAPQSRLAIAPGIGSSSSDNLGRAEPRPEVSARGRTHLGGSGFDPKADRPGLDALLAVAGAGYTQVVLRDASGQPLQPWDALVKPADWHRLQAVVATRHGGRGPRPHEPTLLGGDLFRCASCGARMSGDRRTGGSGTYRCTLHRRGSASCPGAAVAMSHTDDHVVRAVFDRLRDLDPERDPADAALMRAVVSRYTSHHSDPATTASQRAALTVLADADAGLARLDDDRAAGVFSGPTGTDRYRRQSAALSDRADAARATLASLPRASDAEDVAERWRDRTVHERHDFIFVYQSASGRARSGQRGEARRADEQITNHWRAPLSGVDLKAEGRLPLQGSPPNGLPDMGVPVPATTRRSMHHP